MKKLVSNLDFNRKFLWSVRRCALSAIVCAVTIVGVSPITAPPVSAISTPTFTPLTPARLLDTRAGSSTVDGVAQGSGPVGAGAVLDLQIAGRGGVPTVGATAVVLNITAVAPSAGGYTTVFPSGAPQPNASSLNWTPGIVIPNLVTVKIGTNGKISIFNSDGATNYLADVTGWYSDSGFTALAPARLADTRSGGTTIDGVSAGIGKVGAGATIDVTIAGRGGVPASGATSAILNVTVVGPSSGGYTTVWPTGEAQPNASNLNFVPGQVIPNAVTTKLGTGGKISIFNSSGLSDYIVDVVGYFDATSTFTPLSPSRLVDTRFTGTTIDTLFRGQGARFAALSSAFQVTGRGGVPLTGVAAVVLNVTVIARGDGYATIYPTGESVPNASSLNFINGQTIPNMVVAKVGSGGKVSGYNGGNGYVDTIVDVVGYFSGTTPPDTTTLPQAAVVSIGSGATSSCAVLAGGTVRCWGFNTSGQLGNGTTVGSAIPVSVSGLSGVSQVGGGSTHFCALAGGTVSCWGSNLWGQLGIGTSGATAFATTPQLVPGISTATQLAVGDFHTCVVLADQTVRCWGSNQSSELGIGAPDAAAHPIPTLVTGLVGVRKLVAASNSCALLTNGSVKCFGVVSLSTGNIRVDSAITVPGFSNGVDIAVSGSLAVCVMNADTTVTCGGQNGSGELGRGTVNVPSITGFAPAAVTGLSGVAGISGGLSTFCANHSNGTVSCWGSNQFSLLGLSPTSIPANSSVPFLAPNLAGISSLALRSAAACAASSAGVQCWGNAILGNGSSAFFWLTFRPFVSGLGNAPVAFGPNFSGLQGYSEQRSAEGLSPAEPARKAA